MTESLSLWVSRSISRRRLRDLCALWRTRRIVAARLIADIVFLLRSISYFTTQEKSRGAGGSLAMLPLEWASLSCAETDGRTIAFYGHQPILSLTSLLSGCISRTIFSKFGHAPWKFHVCALSLHAAANWSRNNGNFPGAVKIFTAASSFAVHWRTASIY